MGVLIPDLAEEKALRRSILMVENQIRDILRRADSNGDGYLSREELKKAFKEFGFKFPEMTASRFLRKVDTKGNGQLAIEEFDIIVD